MENTTIPQTTGLISCPFCNEQIDPKDYFCPVCGKKVREKPLSTSVGRQVIVYLVSFLAPPFGLIWVRRYWKLSDSGKRIAVAIVILTVLSLVIFTWVSVDFIQTLNTQLNQQLNSINSNPYGY